jgi:hypothetical protein
MSYLMLRERSGREARVAGPAVRFVEHLAGEALRAEISRREYARLRHALGLPSPFHRGAFEAGLRMAMLRGIAAAGQRSSLHAVALNVLVSRCPQAGIMAWLYEKGTFHGWACGADRGAMAAEIQAAIDAGAAPGLAGDQHQPDLVFGGLVIPKGDRGGWEEAITFLRGGDGDVVTSNTIGDVTFPSQEIAEKSPGWQPLGEADDYDGDDDDDYQAEASAATWDALSEEEQWDACLPVIQAAPGLQWNPDGSSYRFGPLTLDRAAGLVVARYGTGSHAASRSAGPAASTPSPPSATPSPSRGTSPASATSSPRRARR